jgi:DNA-binding transcriptional ArsR family regulator
MHPDALELAEEQAAHCRAFGNARRLLILWILSGGELSVSEVAGRAGTTLQNVSQHLKLLRRSGIVTARRDGQTIYYKTADSQCLRHCLASLRTSARSNRSRRR